MTVNWKRVAELQNIYSVSDFQHATMRLLNEQILYQANPKQRMDYDLIAKYENEFSKAMEVVGAYLDHNSLHRYVAAIPTNTETSKIPLKHTLLVLVLRKLYDHHMNRGSLNAGIAGVDLLELETAYKASTGRELPMKPQSELLELLEATKRWGIARAVKDENLNENFWFVEILPGIQSLINEPSLAILKAYAEGMYEPEDRKENSSISVEDDHETA